MISLQLPVPALRLFVQGGFCSTHLMWSAVWLMGGSLANMSSSCSARCTIMSMPPCDTSYHGEPANHGSTSGSLSFLL